MTFTGFPRTGGITDPAVRLLYQFGQEVQTGLTTAAVTLENEPMDGTLLFFKNGVLLTVGAGAARYTRVGTAITLGTAAIAGDEFTAQYHYRSSRNA